jgi:membrane-bound lytic murein transglycosylase B
LPTPIQAEEPERLASNSNEYSVILPGREIIQQPAGAQGGDFHPFLKGWDHLFDLLVDAGQDPQYLSRIFADSRMPTRETLYFSLQPRESSAPYRRLNTKSNRRNALRFYQAYKGYFRAAEQRYGVPQSIVLSLLQIETGCGKNTGNQRVFPGLARLASAAAPENVARNFERKQNTLRKISFTAVNERAQVLQNLFLAHTSAAIDVARAMHVHPLELRGSGAGAIGIPQFLPGNIDRFGIDGDKNGSVDMFSPPDAIFSVANFLNAEGWQLSPGQKKALSLKQKRQILKTYNRSDPYVSTVLAMAAALQKEMKN